MGVGESEMDCSTHQGVFCYTKHLSPVPWSLWLVLEYRTAAVFMLSLSPTQDVILDIYCTVKPVLSKVHGTEVLSGNGKLQITELYGKIRSHKWENNLKWHMF